MNLLNEINLRGTTVVVATHAKDIVDQMRKRVIHIHKGVIVKDDKKGGYDYTFVYMYYSFSHLINLLCVATTTVVLNLFH